MGALMDKKKNGALGPVFLRLLAEWTGLEPATPGVTGRYSNQLNYHSAAVRRLPACAGQVPQNLATLRGFEPRYSP
jgi:hypothetical protein